MKIIKNLEYEWHWKKVRQGRETLEKLWKSGVPLSDPQMLESSRQLDYHCACVWQLEEKL